MTQNSVLARAARALVGVGAWACLAAVAAPPPIEGAAQVESAARQLLAEQAALKGLVEPTFELSVVGSPQALAPCRQPVVIEPLDTRSLSRLRFSATCAGEGGWQRDWTVRAEVSARVVVAATDLPPNRVLTDADLGSERRKLFDVSDALGAPQAAVGLVSNRSLRSGQVVSPRFLSQPVLVRRGDGVNITVRSGPIEVNMAGEALEAGRRGEMLRVRNSSTGKVIRARVLDVGVVEPEGMASSSSSQSPQSRD